VVGRIGSFSQVKDQPKIVLFMMFPSDILSIHSP